MITNDTIQRELTAADWHRLNGLLAEALDLEGEARTAWLAALPAETADLKPLLAQLLADAGSTRFEGTSETLRPVVALAAAAMAGDATRGLGRPHRSVAARAAAGRRRHGCGVGGCSALTA